MHVIKKILSFRFSIPDEKIYELGNFTSITSTTNIPDIKFDPDLGRPYPGWPPFDQLPFAEIIE